MASGSDTAGIVRRLLPYSSAGLVLALLYVGYTFYSRWDARQTGERAAKAAEAREDQRVTDLYGGGEMKILAFYANPGIERQGGETTLCYGVSNAKTVQIEPYVDKVWPALNRCMTIAPKKETKYTLTASDPQGKSVTASLVVQVK